MRLGISPPRVSHMDTVSKVKEHIANKKYSKKVMYCSFKLMTGSN